MITHQGLTGLLRKAFLPDDPSKVHPSYGRYQLLNGLQAVASAITGLFASRAMLQSLGIGDVESSPTAALFVQISQDTVGRITTILFGSLAATALDREVKSYRFIADILNDLALVVDLSSPHLPKSWFVWLSCCSMALKSGVGVAAGTKNVILASQVTPDILAQVNAKNASQGTVIQLFSTLFGAIIMRYIAPTGSSIYLFLACLITSHLLFNYYAVRSVVLTSLNSQRLFIVSQEWAKSGKVLTPEEVSGSEKVMPWLPLRKRGWLEVESNGVAGVGDQDTVDCFVKHVGGDRLLLEKLQASGWNGKILLEDSKTNKTKRE